MSEIKWDKPGEHFFETGVDHGVLYVVDAVSAGSVSWKKGVAWNGLSSVTQSPEGADPTAIYADNIKYLNILSVEEFKATIEAYTYPDEFMECDGSAELVPGTGVRVSQQARKAFCFSYRTKIGNDLDPEAGYKIHIIYNALAAPSESAYETVNDSPEAIQFSWEISTTPVEVDGMKPTAHLVIDSTKVPAEKLALIEEALYGTESSEPHVLMPDDIIAILNGHAPEQLDKPVLSKNDTDQELTITVDAASHAESFDVYEGHEFIKNVAKSATATVVAYGATGLNLGAGNHTIKVKSQAAGYSDSEFSLEITIAVAE